MVAAALARSELINGHVGPPLPQRVELDARAKKLRRRAGERRRLIVAHASPSPSVESPRSISLRVIKATPVPGAAVASESPGSNAVEHSAERGGRERTRRRAPVALLARVEPHEARDGRA